jgi:hypothetical protein
MRRQLYERLGEATICGARPLRGDGSLWCTLEPNHKGLHEDDGKAFRRIIPGSSVRSRVRFIARRRRR